MGRPGPEFQKQAIAMKRYSFKVNGKQYDVNVNSVEGGVADVTVNGTSYRVELGGETGSAPSAVPETATAQAQAAPAKRPDAPSAGSQKVTAPLPGVIIEVSVKEGQAVKAGEKVAVLEAMKMENEIAAPVSGTVTAIHVSKGDSVLEGDPVVTLA